MLANFTKIGTEGAFDQIFLPNVDPIDYFTRFKTRTTYNETRA